jgi:transposase-like protein
MGQTRQPGLDDCVLGLHVGGMSVRDIARHLSELDGTESAAHGQPRD